VVGVVGVLAIGVAGCGDDAGTAPDTKSGSNVEVADVIKPVTGTPKKGGTLIVGLDAENIGLSPATDRFAAAGYTVGLAIFDPLMSIGADLKPHPYLAESVTPSNEYHTWDIKVRPNIKFHDGTPLNSAAVKNYVDKFKAGQNGTALKPLKSVEVVDDLTVRTQFDQTITTFPLYLALQAGLIAAPSMLESPDGNQHPIGTGPYRFKSWEHNKSLVLERNPDYWRKDVTYLDGIDFRPIDDNNVRYNALKAGSIDVMMTPREPTIIDLTKDGQAGTFQIVRAKGDNDVNALMMNTSKPPFDDIRLRQAVAAAIDRSQLLALSNSPPEVAADSVYTKDSKWYVDPHYPATDKAKATQLVQQIEAEKGPLTLTLITVPDQEIAKNVTVMQAQLQEIGIDVKVDTIEQATLISKAISGDYQFLTWRQFGGVDPDSNYLWWHSDYATGSPALNMARNIDKEIDAALTAGRTSADEAVRKEAYGKVQARLAIDLPYVWLSHLRYTMGAANKVRGLEGATFPDGTKQAPMVQGAFFVQEMWLDQ